MDDWIGLRVARYRDIAGMTQQQLADRAGVSRPYIAQIEGGHRPVTTRALLIRLAEALGVSTPDLVTTPPVGRSDRERVVHQAVPGVRAALDAADDVAPIPAERLADEVDRFMAARMACDYPALAELMAPTIARTLAATEAGDVDARQLLARAVFTASMVLRPLGYVDLATRLAERAQWAAAGADDPAAVAAAEFALAQAALTSGLRARSLTLASRAADAIQADTTEDGRAWYALLHLQAGLSSAALGDTETAAGHLDEAADVATTVTGDPWRMDLSPANAGVWRVAAVLEGNDPGRAVELARGVDRHALRTTQRQAHLHTFAGRALYLTGDHNAATRSYLEADRLAPAEIRGRGSVQEIVGQMIRDARRQAGSDQLRDLAVRVGVDPLQPQA